jgi:hypothetical protein
MITITNNDDNGNDDMTWKVVRTGKSTTLLGKAKQHEHVQTSRIERDHPKPKNSSEQDDGGFKAQVNSGTVEVRFMTDPAKRN